MQIFTFHHGPTSLFYTVARDLLYLAALYDELINIDFIAQYRIYASSLNKVVLHIGYT